MGQYYKPCTLGKNKKRILNWVYSHDYESGLKLMEHSWMENPFVKAFERLIHKNPQCVVWAGDYADECKGMKTNCYSRCDDNKKVTPQQLSILDSLYVINHTKKQFVDKSKVPNNDGWRIHPLPLLTCEGNGRGGGDFRKESPLVGCWARDIISVDNEVPQGYKELTFDLSED